MQKLGIDINEVDNIIFSHGHIDHTGGLPYLLDKRTNEDPLTLIGHPQIRETKFLKIIFFKKTLSFPTLSENQLSKVNFFLTNEVVQVLPYISTSGEINERSEKVGREPNAFHHINSRDELDLVLDDQSLVLDTTEGVVILTGCCHAGILNTCKLVQKQYKKPIKAIIGGIHLVRFSKAEVMAVARVLEEQYGTPILYLNHCTDQIPIPFVRKTKGTELLKQRFGSEVVRNCHVGTQITYTC